MVFGFTLGRLLARSATTSIPTSSAGVASVAEKGPIYAHTARGFATGTREVGNVADPLHSATNDIKALLPVDATKFYEMAGTTERQYVPEGYVTPTSVKNKSERQADVTTVPAHCLFIKYILVCWNYRYRGG
jgi:hypothetical protein